MPISVRCQCGKTLRAPDAAVGKAVKCPGCGSSVPVRGASASPKPAQARASAESFSATAPTSVNRMDSLFDEEGLTEQVAAVCPACRQEMDGTAVLCVKCGFNKETGTRLNAHLTAGVDIDRGTLALMKAEQDMREEATMQEEMERGAGLPWWGLALVLFIIGSGLSIAVLVVNASRRLDQNVDFDPWATFGALSGSACTVVGLGAYFVVVAHAFRIKPSRGVLAILPPYWLFHAFANIKRLWRPLIVFSVMCGAAGGLFSLAF